MKYIVAFFSLVALFLSACTQAEKQDIPKDWKTECIGRYQISLPGEVEMLLPTPSEFRSAESGSALIHYLFSSQTLKTYISALSK